MALKDTAGVRARAGLVRAFLALAAMALLVAPVGVEAPGGPRVLSIPEALWEIAGGRMGVGLLAAFVEGGGMAAAAFLRLGMVLAAWVAFALAGMLRPPPTGQPGREGGQPGDKGGQPGREGGQPGREGGQPGRERRLRCPHCGSWASAAMVDCPACGRLLDTP